MRLCAKQQPKRISGIMHHNYDHDLLHVRLMTPTVAFYTNTPKPLRLVSSRAKSPKGPTISHQSCTQILLYRARSCSTKSPSTNSSRPAH